MGHVDTVLVNYSVRPIINGVDWSQTAGQSVKPERHTYNFLEKRSLALNIRPGLFMLRWLGLSFRERKSHSSTFWLTCILFNTQNSIVFKISSSFSF